MIYILGGYQTDFAYNWSKDNKTFYDMMKASVTGALQNADVEPGEISTGHIGNFAGELFCFQGHLGGLFAMIYPEFDGLPTSRHEAACASGSVAVLAAMAEVESGRSEVVCVTGLEQMRNVSGETAGEYLGAAGWVGHEAEEAQYVWPWMFSLLMDEYDQRYGLDTQHLKEIAKINFENARLNPNAQTRGWTFEDHHFTDSDEHNPIVEGRVRRQDCSQLTDGAATIILASEDFAKRYAERRGKPLRKIPALKGWGHRTAPLGYDRKLELAKGSPYVFPQLHQAIEDALLRSAVGDVNHIDAIEMHDCFTITEYMAIDHFGLTEPGKAYELIESGAIRLGGKIPINPSGGLIGGGHPVGATGVRMILDAYKQVTGQAGDYQVENARNIATLNIGGSATTSVCFVVGKE